MSFGPSATAARGSGWSAAPKPRHRGFHRESVLTPNRSSAICAPVLHRLLWTYGDCRNTRGAEYVALRLQLIHLGTRDCARPWCALPQTQIAGVTVASRYHRAPITPHEHPAHARDSDITQEPSRHPLLPSLAAPSSWHRACLAACLTDLPLASALRWRHRTRATSLRFELNVPTPVSAPPPAQALARAGSLDCQPLGAYAWRAVGRS